MEMWYRYGPQGPPPMNPFMMGGMGWVGWPQMPPPIPPWMQFPPASEVGRMMAQTTPEFPYLMSREGGTGNGRAATRKSERPL
jgi:hypothetical protein